MRRWICSVDSVEVFQIDHNPVDIIYTHQPLVDRGRASDLRKMIFVYFQSEQ